MTQPLIRIAQIEQDELTLLIRTVIQTSVPLDDLFDVNVASATEGQILEYGGSPIGWRAVANSGGGLGDVVLGSPITKGEFLVYQGSPSVWVNTDAVRLNVTIGSPEVVTTLQISSTLPSLSLNETDGPVNEKIWRFESTGGDFVGEMLSDSGASSNRWLEVIRNGILASEFSLFVGAEETAIRAIDGGAVQLYHNALNVTETTTAAAGGLRVNNTLTGAGFERVLTLSDLGGGGGGTNVIAGQALFYTGSPETIINVGAGDGLQIIGSPKSIAVDSTVFRTTNNLADISDVNAGSPTIGAILYNDGANWVKLARGTSDQVLTMGSPLLPVWKNNTGGSPSDQLHVVGGDGIDVTYGSPDVTVAVDSTVARSGDNVSIFTNDANYISSGSPGQYVQDGDNISRLVNDVGYLTSIGSPGSSSNIVGGDGVTVVIGSPQYTVAVDGTVLRTTSNLDDLADVDTAGVLENQVLTYAGSPLGWIPTTGASSSGGDSVFAGDGISIVAGSPLTNKTIAVDTTVLRTTSNLDDLANVIGSPTITGDTLYFNGTNWNTLPVGTSGQVLTVGSPLLPSWVTPSIGSPTDQLHVVGGDGITTTYGSPEVTVAVDSTVARLTGSPPTGSPSQVFQNPNTFLNSVTFETNPTTVDGTGAKRPVGLGVLPPYEIDTSSVFDTAHAGMVWHVDAGSPAVTFTAPNDTNIEIGSMWQVQNDDVENVTIAEGSPSVTILRLGAGGAPVSGNVLVQQGGIVSVYKYTDTEYWLYGDSEAIGFGSPISADLKGLIDVSITGGAGSPSLPTTGDILYYDGTNWVNLVRGVSGQVLTMGSPLVPSWQAAFAGSPIDTLHIEGGDGITVTLGSPEVTVAVDATVARISIGSPGLINTGTLIVDTIDLGTRSTITTYETTTVSISQAAVATYAIANYRSAELLVEAVQGNNYHVTKFLTTHDGTNAVSTEYGTVTTPEFFGSPGIGSPAISGEQATYTVDISGGNLRLLATPKTTSSTVFTTTATLIKVKT